MERQFAILNGEYLDSYRGQTSLSYLFDTEGKKPGSRIKRAVIARYDLRVFMYRKTSIGASLVGVSRGTPDEKIHNYCTMVTSSRHHAPTPTVYTYKV